MDIRYTRLGLNDPSHASIAQGIEYFAADEEVSGSNPL